MTAGATETRRRTSAKAYIMKLLSDSKAFKYTYTWYAKYRADWLRENGFAEIAEKIDSPDVPWRTSDKALARFDSWLSELRDMATGARSKTPISDGHDKGGVTKRSMATLRALAGHAADGRIEVNLGITQVYHGSAASPVRLLGIYAGSRQSGSGIIKVQADRHMVGTMRGLFVSQEFVDAVGAAGLTGLVLGYAELAHDGRRFYPVRTVRMAVQHVSHPWSVAPPVGTRSADTDDKYPDEMRSKYPPAECSGDSLHPDADPGGGELTDLWKILRTSGVSGYVHFPRCMAPDTLGSDAPDAPAPLDFRLMPGWRRSLFDTLATTSRALEALRAAGVLHPRDNISAVYMADSLHPHQVDYREPMTLLEVAERAARRPSDGFAPLSETLASGPGGRLRPRPPERMEAPEATAMNDADFTRFVETASELFGPDPYPQDVTSPDDKSAAFRRLPPRVAALFQARGQWTAKCPGWELDILSGDSFGEQQMEFNDWHRKLHGEGMPKGWQAIGTLGIDGDSCDALIAVTNMSDATGDCPVIRLSDGNGDVLGVWGSSADLMADMVSRMTGRAGEIPQRRGSGRFIELGGKKAADSRAGIDAPDRPSFEATLAAARPPLAAGLAGVRYTPRPVPLDDAGVKAVRSRLPFWFPRLGDLLRESATWQFPMPAKFELHAPAYSKKAHADDVAYFTSMADAPPPKGALFFAASGDGDRYCAITSKIDADGDCPIQLFDHETGEIGDEWPSLRELLLDLISTVEESGV